MGAISSGGVWRVKGALWALRVLGPRFAAFQPRFGQLRWGEQAQYHKQDNQFDDNDNP